jgi:hypothetical protein
VTSQRDLERTLDTFFASGTDEVANRVIDAALEAIEHTPQQRVPLLAWRPPSMSTPFKVASAAIAVVLVAIVGAFVLGRGLSGTVGTKPLPSSSSASSPAASPSTIAATPTSSTSPSAPTTSRFTSPIYGYTIELPAIFQPTPATTKWTTSEVILSDATWVDRFFAGPSGAFVGIASQPLPSGTTAAAWMDAYADRAVGRTCGIARDAWTDTTVSGAPGRRAEFPCDVFTGVEIVWVIDGQARAISGDPAVVAGILETIRYE